MMKPDLSFGLIGVMVKPIFCIVGRRQDRTKPAAVFIHGDQGVVFPYGVQGLRPSRKVFERTNQHGGFLV